MLTDIQVGILALATLTGIGIVGYFVLLLAKHNTQAAIAFAGQVRANQPTMDFLEVLGRELVPVGQVYLMASIALNFIPAETDEEKKLRGTVLDILKNLTDGKPWTAPTLPTASPAPSGPPPESTQVIPKAEAVPVVEAAKSDG